MAGPNAGRATPSWADFGGINVRRMFRRWAWMVILFTAIAGGTAAIVSSELPRQYETVTVALVNPKQSSVVVGGAQTFGITSDQLIGTYVRLINAQPVWHRLVIDGIPRAEDSLAGSILAKADPNTSLIDITVLDSDPQVALVIAADIVPAFNASLDDVQTRVSGTTTTTPRLDALIPWQVPTKAPTVPVSPKPVNNTLVGLAAGLLLGIALAFVLETLDRSVKSEYDIRVRLELGLLGSVHFKRDRRGFRNRREEMALVTVIHPRDPVAEAYRAIRTNLLFNALDRHIRTIVVTSAVPGEGKTSTACNLAVAMAQAGNRVFLVDADFRRPELHRVFGYSRNVGLGNYIVGMLPEDQISMATKVSNLRVVCSGPTPPNPSELLGSARMAEAIDRMKAVADVIIFDTPPVGVVTDAAVLAARCDGVILVAEGSRTHLNAIEGARDKLLAVGATILGVVLNKVHRSQTEDYYYDGYYGESEKEAAKRGRKAAGSALETARSGRTAPNQLIDPVAGVPAQQHRAAVAAPPPGTTHAAGKVEVTSRAQPQPALSQPAAAPAVPPPASRPNEAASSVPSLAVRLPLGSEDEAAASGD